MLNSNFHCIIHSCEGADATRDVKRVPVDADGPWHPHQRPTYVLERLTLAGWLARLETMPAYASR